MISYFFSRFTIIMTSMRALNSIITIDRHDLANVGTAVTIHNVTFLHQTDMDVVPFRRGGNLLRIQKTNRLRAGLIRYKATKLFCLLCTR
jgi:hypothetical protein